MFQLYSVKKKGKINTPLHAKKFDVVPGNIYVLHATYRLVTYSCVSASTYIYLHVTILRQ